MEVKAIIKAINPTERVSDKFQKREFVATIDHEGKYPQPILFQCTQDKCSLLDSIRVGEVATIHYNLRGKEWNGGQGIKYFNQLEAWKIEPIKS